VLVDQKIGGKHTDTSRSLRSQVGQCKAYASVGGLGRRAFSYSAPRI